RGGRPTGGRLGDRDRQGRQAGRYRGLGQDRVQVRIRNPGFAVGKDGEILDQDDWSGPVQSGVHRLTKSRSAVCLDFLASFPPATIPPDLLWLEHLATILQKSLRIVWASPQCQFAIFRLNWPSNGRPIDIHRVDE